MGALNVVTGRVTNPGATITALTMDTGDSLTVKNFPLGTPAYIISAWAQTATAGVMRIRSPRLHDVAQGIRLRTGGTVARNLLFDGARQRVVPQDTLTAELSGGGAETDVGAFLIYYPALDGSEAQLVTWEEVAARIVNIAGMEVQVTSSGTAGQYGGSTALNATFDNWKRGSKYAVLGILSDTAGCTVGITGPDTGQVRIGMPMAVEQLVTYDWFAELARDQALPLIPVISAVNIGATNIDCATTSISATVNFTIVCAELS